MLRFLKRLLGIDEGDTYSGVGSHDPQEPIEYPDPQRVRDNPTVTRYFTLLGQLQEAKRQRDWQRAAEAARETIDLLPAFVEAHDRDLPPSIPVFTDGARALAMIGDVEALRALRGVTEAVPELANWREETCRALEDLRHIKAIRILAAERPGVLQTQVRAEIGADDGKRIAVVLRQLEEAGEIQRIQYKRTYVIGVAGVDLPLPDDHPALLAMNSAAGDGPPQDATAEATVTLSFDRAHQRRGSLNTHEISLDGLEYIPLPRAPLRWEETYKERIEPPKDGAYFQLGEDTEWTIDSVEKLSMDERPDPAFRHVAPHAEGTFLIDDLGRAQRHPHAPAALFSVDAAGRVRGEAGLAWNLYRWQVNPMGRGFIAMDSEGVVHAYDVELRRLFATPLAEAPEMSALMTRYHFGIDDLKNHCRTVALAPGGAAYLYSVVDTAFVVGVDGSPLWAVRLPKQEGWTRVADVSEHAGTSRQIDDALRELELRLPVTVNDIRSQYRKLAKRWHPDVNQGSREAEERFKSMARAAELLSGLDPTGLAPELGGAVYQTLQSEQAWEIDGMRITMQVGMQASEKQASDWVYAAAFAADGGVFLAGYTGRIVHIDPSGRPLRAYDIGAVPRRIGDTGDYLYFLTDTRLYVLRDQALVRVLDVFDEGELILGQTGFGLLEKKRFRWFSETGEARGAILTKNPIRRVFSTSDHLVVETRQRRATVSGPPFWWE